MANRSASTTISPYIPDRTEYADSADGTWGDNDIGKAVKFDGENVTLCAAGDPIYGFLQSRSVGTKDTNPIFSLNPDLNREQLASDEAGTLAVGDFVVAGTQAAIGTAVASANGTPVKVDGGVLTDNSTGTASDTIAAIGATYNQDQVRNAVASLAAKVNLLLGVRSGWQVVSVYGTGAGRQVLLRRV
jgi:hypothetical protein